MTTAKLFQNGSSQAVRLPKQFRFEGEEVVVKRFGGAVILLPLRYRAQALKNALETLDPGFKIARAQPKRRQKRNFD